MKPYLASLCAGVLVGAIYSLLNVRSPAPPVIALVGLLGILIGEQTVPLLRHLMAEGRVGVSWFESQCRPHLFGRLPEGCASPAAPPDPASQHEG
ncbi:XapX domain-containing protein [Paracoccus sp. MBLB3053]|uniref:XapX domain-containing protein n=1 Tax=Paracoccus aurantius TaxID=3073814 RepID=A0ABU2HV15_9RHOB|nr:XapX domain-containing protein [Paracoccus sp. MBLB3053]MDS9468881.1 XapX domain-containing protein [Paracoccus sp. MBLB3053]